ncbi:MAG: hypothetical protein ABJB40_06985 [Acidobacteriota bacterium]
MKYLYFIAAVIICMCLVVYTYHNVLPPSPAASTSQVAEIRETLRVDGNIDKRRKFAIGLEMNPTENTSKNARYAAEGDKATILVLTADGVSAGDCDNFQKSTDGQAAASIGFTTLTCRNPISNGEWSLALSK